MAAESPAMALATTPSPPESKLDQKDMVPPSTAIAASCDPWPQPYYLEDGLRKVQPYHFTYKTNCKQRWRGQPLLKVFSTEFRDRPLEYYKEAIESGKVTVNGKKAETVDQILKNGDVISHALHRHEPPVTAREIGIIHEDDGLIVINKPAGIPVHPAGRYNHNCVIELMRVDRGNGWNPMPCNRLDRLTSGIMFVGKHAQAADEMQLKLKARSVRKEYVARVIGEFPEGDVVCTQPVMQISPKLGLNRARASGKDARTVFKRLAYYPARPEPPAREDTRTEEEIERDEKMPWKRLSGYSIVRCHPIANDPIYCNSRVFGPDLGIGDASSDHDDDIIKRLSRMGKDEVADSQAYHEEMMVEYNKKKAEKMTGEVCDVCATPLYSDPGPHELGIYLHAKRYECAEGNWAYETELPDWALPPEGEQGPTAVTAESDPSVLAEGVEKLELGRDGAAGVDVKEQPHTVNGST